MQYSECASDHFFHPRNVGRLDESAPDTGTGKAGMLGVSEYIIIQIRVDEQMQKILEVAFKASGKPSIIACGSFFTELIKDQDLRLLPEIKAEDLQRELQFRASDLHTIHLTLQAGQLAYKELLQKASDS